MAHLPRFLPPEEKSRASSVPEEERQEIATLQEAPRGKAEAFLSQRGGDAPAGRQRAGAGARGMACRTRSSSSGPAFDGAPHSNGGWGSYSMLSCIPFAVSSPAILATSVRAMSMPEDTPAEVMIFPCGTTRSSA